MNERSALRENIQSKGAHSYYYAWSDVYDVSGDKYKPRKIDKEDMEIDEQGPIAVGSGSRSNVGHVRGIERYSFLDKPKKVKIFVQYEEHERHLWDDLKEDQIMVDVRARSVEVIIPFPDVPRRFYVNKLYGDLNIEKCKVRMKQERLVITLAKMEELAWKTLTRS